MTVFLYIMLILFLLLCVTLSFAILIQEAKSMGLGASFGGDTGDSLFGTSTAEVLKRFTAYMAGFFLLSCLILSLWSAAIGRTTSSDLMPPNSPPPIEEEY
jgi:preprotein translocase subunit SecG